MKCIFVVQSWLKHHSSSFSVTWSSEIILIYWFAAPEIFLIIINVGNSCAASYFGETLFSGLFDDKEVQKNSIYLK